MYECNEQFLIINQMNKQMKVVCSYLENVHTDGYKHTFTVNFF